MSPDAIANHVIETINASSSISAEFEQQGFSKSDFVRHLIDMMDAQTHDSLGNPMPDNKAKMDALKLISALCSFGGASRQKTENIKILLQSIGVLKSSKGLSVNFSFTKFLHENGL